MPLPKPHCPVRCRLPGPHSVLGPAGAAPLSTSGWLLVAVKEQQLARPPGAPNTTSCYGFSGYSPGWPQASLSKHRGSTEDKKLFQAQPTSTEAPSKEGGDQGA